MLIYCLLKQANVFTITLQMHLRSSIPEQKYMTAGIRFLFVICSLYGFIIASSYESGIIGLMTKPQWSKQPKALADIIKTDLKMGWLSSIPNYLSQNSDKTWSYLLKHTVTYEDIEVGLNRTVTERDMCSLLNNLKVQYLTPSYYLDGSGHTLYYQLDDKLRTFSVEMLLTRHHCLLEPFNVYLGRLINSGLVIQWLEELKTHHKLKADGIKLFVLSLHHMQGPIVLYALGVMLASLVLAGEFFFRKLQIKAEINSH